MQAARPLSPAVPLVDEASAPTLAELYLQRAALTPDAIACRQYDADTQSWIDISWAAFQARAACYAEGLQHAGLRAGDRVGIQIPNGVDWLAIDCAAHLLGLVVVGLHSEDTAAASAWILADADVKCLFVRDAEALTRLNPQQSLPELRQVVLMHGANNTQDARVQTLRGWLPVTATLPASRAEPEALATIAYTSGSTGRPKGVMLSQANIIANAFACLRAIGPQPGDLMLSILPLTHMFERTVGAYFAVAAGVCIIYGRGPAQLGEDLKQQRPTLMLAAPRVYERIHAAFLGYVAKATPAQRALFRLGVEAGWRVRSAGSDRRRWLLFTPLAHRAGEFIRNGLGGRLRLTISGGAPLSENIARMFIACGVPVLQGYGLTEAGPVVSVNRLDDNDPASVGRALDNVETRIGADGELMVRSPAVMMGYWRDVESTRAAIDTDGWLHTGDKVSRLDTSHLYLTGRIKDIIITSTGEKAAPSDIEQRLSSDALFEQLLVIGEARPYLAALIVPEAGRLAQLRTMLGLAEGDDSEAARARIEQALLERCRALLRDRPRSQQLIRVGLVTTPWTIGNGLVTATYKLRRVVIARNHADDIERLYAGHVSASKTDCSRNAEI